MSLLTSQQVADLLGQQIGCTVYPPRIRVLAEANLLTNHGTRGRHFFDSTEVASFLATHPHIRTLPFGHLRVSVLPTAPDIQLELAPPHRRFRTHMGYDRRNTAKLRRIQRTRGITAAWDLRRDDAHRIVEESLPIVGCVKGVVEPDMIFWPHTVVPLMNGLFGFDCDPARVGHPAVPTGAIIDVGQGNLWKLIYSP